jgi:hypothetical protein
MHTTSPRSPRRSADSEHRLWAAAHCPAERNRRFVLAHPQQVGRGEAGHGEIAGHLPQSWKCGLQVRTFGRSANIVPQDGWTQHSTRFVQKHRSMHLAGQADTLDGGQGCSMLAPQSIDDVNCHAPGSLGRSPRDRKCRQRERRTSRPEKRCGSGAQYRASAAMTTAEALCPHGAAFRSSAAFREVAMSAASCGAFGSDQGMFSTIISQTSWPLPCSIALAV